MALVVGVAWGLDKLVVGKVQHCRHHCSWVGVIVVLSLGAEARSVDYVMKGTEVDVRGGRGYCAVFVGPSRSPVLADRAVVVRCGPRVCFGSSCRPAKYHVFGYLQHYLSTRTRAHVLRYLVRGVDRDASSREICALELACFALLPR